MTNKSDLLRWLFGSLKAPSVSFDDDPKTAIIEFQYRVKKQLRKMNPEDKQKALKGEMIRMRLKDAEAVAAYNATH